MHARDLIETAATLCVSAPQILDSSPEIGSQTLAEYWAASRCRLDEWGRRLSFQAHHPRTSTADSSSGASSAGPVTDPACDLALLAEDIVLSQPLTRAVAAVTVAHDRRHHASEAGPVGRNTLAGHNEAVSRVQALAKAWWRPRSQRATRLRRLTSRTERWTDLLLAYVLPLCGTPGDGAGHAVEFTFDPTRAQEFAYDTPVHADGLGAADQLLHASIRTAFAAPPSAPACPTAALNRRIAAAAIGLFGPESFDGHGLLRSTWQQRLERTTSDTLGLVEDLFRDTPPQFKTPARWRI